MENPSKENQFRIWLKKNYGIQDYENYRNTQTEELAIQYAEYKAKEVNAAIGNLLAVMHGDGGHYREQHGLIKSIEDAQKLLHVKWKSIEAEGNHGINNDLPGHLIEPDFLFPKHTVLGQGYHIKKDYNKLTESAYKEVEKPTPLHDMQVAMGQIVESSEPQENIFDLPKDVVFDLQRIALADDEMSAGFGAGVEYRLIARSILNKHRKPVSAHSESQEEQEELWKEARHYIDVWRIEELFKRFTIRRNGDKD